MTINNFKYTPKKAPLKTWDLICKELSHILTLRAFITKLEEVLNPF